MTISLLKSLPSWEGRSVRPLCILILIFVGRGGVVAMRRADDLCFDILCGCLFCVWAWCVRVVVVYNL